MERFEPVFPLLRTALLSFVLAGGPVRACPNLPKAGEICSGEILLRVSGADCDGISTPSRVVEEPKVTLLASGDPNANYILFMLDPDASDPNSPTQRYYSHWIVYNIKLSGLSGGPIGGQKANYYLPPRPILGPHRYQIFLFEQPASFRGKTLPRSTGRENFDFPRYALVSGLCTRLKASFQFTVRSPGALATGEGATLGVGEPQQPARARVRRDKGDAADRLDSQVGGNRPHKDDSQVGGNGPHKDDSQVEGDGLGNLDIQVGGKRLDTQDGSNGADKDDGLGNLDIQVGGKRLDTQDGSNGADKDDGLGNLDIQVGGKRLDTQDGSNGADKDDGLGNLDIQVGGNRVDKDKSLAGGTDESTPEKQAGGVSSFVTSTITDRGQVKLIGPGKIGEEEEEEETSKEDKDKEDADKEDEDKEDEDKEVADKEDYAGEREEETTRVDQPADSGNEPKGGVERKSTLSGGLLFVFLVVSAACLLP